MFPLFASFPASPSVVCPYESHSYATIVRGDMTHLTTAPPDIPNTSIPLKRFVKYSSIRSSKSPCGHMGGEGVTPWEKKTLCWGHVTRQAGGLVLELCVALIGREREEEKSEAVGGLQNVHIQHQWTGHINLTEGDIINDMSPFILGPLVSLLYLKQPTWMQTIEIKIDI